MQESTDFRITEVQKRLPNGLAELLAKTKVQDVIATRKFVGHELIIANADDTLETGMRMLARAGISSIPVLGPDNKMMGFVDLLDICKFFAVRARESNRESMEKEFPQLLHTKLRELVDFSKKDPMVQPVFEGAPALEVAITLGKGVHRMLVFNEQKVFSLISQADLIRYLSTFLEMKGSEDKRVQAMADRTVLETGAVSQLWDIRRPVGVLSINADATVFQALLKLASTGASGLAVLDPKTGALFGNFSAADLKAFVTDPKNMPFELYFQNVGTFLARHSPASTKPVTALLRPEGPSFGSVLSLAAKTRVHRVWLVNEAFKPVGVCTLTNLISVVVSYEQDECAVAGAAKTAAQTQLADKKID